MRPTSQPIPPSPLPSADLCPQCSTPMRWERAHYTCDVCHLVGLTCCEGSMQHSDQGRGLRKDPLAAVEPRSGG